MKPLSLTKPGKTGHHTGSGGLAAEYTTTRDAFDELEKRIKEMEQLWLSNTGYREMVQRLTDLEATCGKFSAKKRTCGECVYLYRSLGNSKEGPCWRVEPGTGKGDWKVRYAWNEACDNFKGK